MKWMKKLALHYEGMKEKYPNDKLMILFDIDGTILDMRHMILHVLKSYDEDHATRFFENLNLGDITVHENQVESLLIKMGILMDQQNEILEWYNAHRWTPQAILTSHKPFLGVMEVIRWFQMQPNTFVGLNTGRPGTIRPETLRSINKLGEEYKVRFANEFLHMNPYGWDQRVKNAKAEAVNHFRKAGYYVFAMVDNEPDNLKAISEEDPDGEVLLLHANTIFESKRRRLPSRSISGKIYDITELIDERALPQHVQFVWHGVNDEANLRQFISSNIQWAECDVRLDPGRIGMVILRHDSFDEVPLQEGENFVFLKEVLKRFRAMGKSIKLDFKENVLLIERTIDLLKMLKFEDKNLWFNAKVDVVKEKGFRKLKRDYPKAIIQCPIDHLIKLILRYPSKVKAVLFELKEQGINRFSIKWNTPDLRKVLDRLDRMGLEVNIYNVPDLETFLKTILLMPRSITCDFNFPKWNYFGRGSGEKLQHYEYSISKFPKIA